MKRSLKIYILVLLPFICALVFQSCNDDVEVDAVYITAAEKTSTTSFSARNNGDNLGITVSTSLIAEADVSVELSIDNSLVERYNKDHNEAYQSLPEGTCSLSESSLLVTKGNYRSDAIKLIVNDVEKVGKGVNYLLPIKLVSKSKDYPSLPGSDVLYVIINRTMLVNVPKLNGRNYFKVEFKDNDVSRLQNLDAFTMEVRVNLWKFPFYNGSTGNNLMGILGFPQEEPERSAWLFVDGTPDRVGGKGNIPVFMFGVKGWGVYAGKLGFTIEKDAWYHVAGVFSENKLKLYIDGELFVETEYKNKVSFIEKFYIGASPGVQNGFYLEGSVSEARLWRRALSATELKNPLHKCYVESDSEGLEGYWKLDDGKDVCIDYSGNGHDAVKGGSGVIEWMEEVPCP